MPSSMASFGCRLSSSRADAANSITGEDQHVRFCTAARFVEIGGQRAGSRVAIRIIITPSATRAQRCICSRR
jgi:hypothetical protein